MDQWKRRASLVFRLLVLLNFHHVDAGFIPDEALDTINSSSTFSCHGRILGDFYTDVLQGCRVFHACVLNDAGATVDVPLACAPGTLFDQPSRQCQPQDNVHCTEEYASNADGLQEMVDANNVVQRRRRSNEDEEEVEEERETDTVTAPSVEMKSTKMPKKMIDVVPKTHFTCRDKKMGSYYADVESGCKLFHICALGVAGEVLDFRFLCLNQTQFNPETKSCELSNNCPSSKKMMEELPSTTTMTTENVDEVSTTRKPRSTTTTPAPELAEDEDTEDELEEEEEVTTLPPARKRTLVEDEVNRRTRGRSSSKNSAQTGSKRRPSRKELEDDEDQEGTEQRPIFVEPEFQVLSEGVRTKRQVVMMPASGAPGAPCFDYSNLPLTTFTCANKLPGNYYADPEAMCQMYHVCAPSVSIQSLIDFRFLCPNETVFDQSTLKCTTFGSVDCVNAPLLYALAEPIIPAMLPNADLVPSEVLAIQGVASASEENVPLVVADQNAAAIEAAASSDGSLGIAPELVIPMVPEVPTMRETPDVAEPAVVEIPEPAVVEIPEPAVVEIPEPAVVVEAPVDSVGEDSADEKEEVSTSTTISATKKTVPPATTEAVPKTTETPTTSKPKAEDNPDAVFPAIGPDMVIPAVDPDMVVPAFNPDMVVPAFDPDMVVAAVNEDMVIPVASPDMVVPAAGTDIVAPAAGPDVVVPAVGPEIAIPAVSSEMISPVTGPNIAPPAANSGMAAPAGNPEITIVAPGLEMAVAAANFETAVPGAGSGMVVPDGVPAVLPTVDMMMPQSLSNNFPLNVRNAALSNIESGGLRPQMANMALPQPILGLNTNDHGQESAISAAVAESEVSMIQDLPLPGVDGIAQAAAVDQLVSSALSPIGLDGSQQSIPPIPVPGAELIPTNLPAGASIAAPITTDPTRMGPVTNMMQSLMLPGIMSSNMGVDFYSSQYGAAFMPIPFFDIPLPTPAVSLPKKPIRPSSQSLVSPLFQPFMDGLIMAPPPLSGNPMFVDSPLAFGFPQPPVPFGLPQPPVPFGNTPYKKPSKKKPVIKKPVTKKPQPAFPFGQMYYPPLVEIDRFIPPMFFQQGMGGGPNVLGNVAMPNQMQTFKPSIASNIQPVVPVMSATPIVTNSGPQVPVVTEGILQPVPAGSEFIELWIQQSPIYVHGWRVREKRAADKDIEEDDGLDLEEGEEVEERNAFQPAPISLHHLPKTSFSCVGKVTGGYYADVETGCQLFHVCALGGQGEVYDFKFLCTNDTAFNQPSQTCAIQEKVDCASAPLFYPREPESVANVPVPNAEIRRLKVPTASRIRNKRETVVDSDNDPANFPDTSFNCKGKKSGGYYADPETDCHVFHVCARGEAGQMVDFRFRCANETVFNQRSNTCDEAKEVDCENSVFLYNSDDEFSALSRIPDTDEDEDK